MTIAAYLKNLFYTTSKKKVLKELLSSKKQDISYLIVFGYLIYIEIPKKKGKK